MIKMERQYEKPIRLCKGEATNDNEHLLALEKIAERLENESKTIRAYLKYVKEHNDKKDT